MTLNRLDDSGQPLPAPDVQRTTLSIDVMGRYVCNTWNEAVDNGGAPFDAVVIGAGMFGGYLADKLFRAGNLRVLVLEAGPFLVSSHLQNLPRFGLFEPQPIDPASDDGTPRNLVWGLPWRGNTQAVGQAFCVGGKSLYWGGWCPTLLDDDLAHWRKSSPEAAEYLKATYPVLQRQVGIVDSSDNVSTEYLEGPLFDALKEKADSIVAAKAVPNLDTSERAPLAVQGTPPASGLFPFDKYSSAFLLVGAVREAANASDHDRRLYVVANTRVIRLQTGNGVITAVEVSTGGARQVLAIQPTCAVVLALGAIESTRLALISFPRTANAEDELMGRNLMVHIRDNTKATIKRKALDPAGELPRKLQAAAMLARGSTEAGKFHLQITASANVGGDPDDLLYSMIPDVDQVDTLLAMDDADSISFWFRGVSEVQGDKTTPVPNATRSWINLSPFERDEFGMPRAYVHIQRTDDDIKTAQVMDDATLALVKALAGGQAGDFNAEPTTREAAGATYHESGTLWMGDNFRTSVTDANGGFHHVANAFCTDQALFPTVGSVNPTLTGLTLTRKVAEALVARATETPVSPLEPGFIALFTDTLKDWQNTGGGGVNVVDGLLETFGGIGLAWYDRQEFYDFDLRLDWRSANITDNSGVFIRFPNLKGLPATVADTDGYEVQIDERGFSTQLNAFGDPLSRTGAVYHLAPARQGASKRLGLWNSYQIVAFGPRITVHLNGQFVCDFNDPKPRSLRGFIGLQYHTGKVQFRSVRIKPL